MPPKSSVTLSAFVNQEYQNFIRDIKAKIQHSQIKASLKVNHELIELYWNLSKMIADKQTQSKWGDSLLKQIELDLKLAMPNLKRFSRTNLM